MYLFIYRLDREYRTICLFNQLNFKTVEPIKLEFLLWLLSMTTKKFYGQTKKQVRIEIKNCFKIILEIHQNKIGKMYEF